MPGAQTPWAFLDASALYPSLLRNIFMHLALHELFRPFWSAQVQDEWTRAVLRNHAHLSSEQVERTRRLMNENIDDANVAGFEHLIQTVTLPDADDRHVLAAAIHCGADIIVTANLRHFPASILSFHEIVVQHPDAFILGLFNGSPHEVIAALRGLEAVSETAPCSRCATYGNDPARLDSKRASSPSLYRWHMMELPCLIW